MHIDAHFLELEYFNYDNIWSPSKVSFSLHSFKVLKFYFFVRIENSFCVCNMLKHDLNNFWRSHMNELKKWKVMIILYVCFVQWDNNTKRKKKNESRGGKK
jgi:hypothetical protein